MSRRRTWGTLTVQVCLLYTKHSKYVFSRVDHLVADASNAIAIASAEAFTLVAKAHSHQVWQVGTVD